MPHFPNESTGEEETKWVVPEKFFGELEAVLDEVAPLPGEEAIYANVRSVLAAAAKDDKLKAALQQAAADADKELVTPLFQFKDSGLPLPHNWSTINNGAALASIISTAPRPPRPTSSSTSRTRRNTFTKTSMCRERG